MSVRRNDAEKPVRRPAEVCAELDIQPYVLKFWEGEFPLLGRRIGPKRNYGPVEFEITREIRRLLEEEGLSLADARTSVDRLFGGDGTGAPATAESGTAAASPVGAGLASEASVTRPGLASEASVTRPGLASEASVTRPSGPSAPEDELSCKLDAALDELREARSALQRATSRAADADKAEERAAALERDVQRLSARPADASEAEARLAALDLELAQARGAQADVIATLRREVETQQTRVVHLQEELHRSLNEAVPLRETNARLEADMGQLRLHTAEERAALDARIASLEARREALEPVAARVPELESEIARLAVHVEEQGAEIDRLIAELNQARESAARERDELTRAHELEHARLVAAMDAERARLTAELEAGQSRLAQLTEAADAAQVAGTALGTRLDEAHEHIARLERQLNETTEWADAASRRAAELPELQGKLTTLQQETGERETRMLELEGQVGALEQERAELQHRLQTAEETAATLEALLSEAESERDQLRTRASEDVGAALRRVREIGASAEKLMMSLASASVAPVRRAPGSDVASASAAASAASANTMTPPADMPRDLPHES